MNKTADMQKSRQVYEYICFNREELARSQGNRLPTEEQLSELTNTDRFAVRRALKRLAEDGIIHAVRNRGYFFDLQSTRVSISGHTSYHAFCAAANLVPKVEITGIAEELPDDRVRSRLALDADATVWCIQFLRYRGELPFCLTRSWLPRARTPGLVRHIQQESSLYRVLADFYGIQPRRQSTECSAVNASPFDARKLDLPLSFALLKACSLATDQKGIPVEYCETLYRGDIVSLSFDMEGVQS